jgi:argininosuccinate lyase
MTPLVVKGIRKVLADGELPGAKRPTLVITFEPLLIQAAGPQITLLHAGRSSQDMLATLRAAILREDLLTLANQLNATTAALVKLAASQRDTIVPNYTNGVAAQPNSYGHYLLGLLPRWTAMPSACARPMRASTARPWAPPCSTAPAGR